MVVNIFESVRQGTLDVSNLTAEDINKRSCSSGTLLHEAIGANQDEISLALIKKGIDINAQDNELRTPLFVAATYQNETVVNALVDAGADINIVDKHGNSALWAALMSSRKNYNLFTYLLNKGGNPALVNKTGTSCVSFARNTDNQMLLNTLKNYLET
jgi:ankyrin repeat protein